MDMNYAEREVMDFDVVIVGAGPSGLSAACRLKQLAAETGTELAVCVLEKGAYVGAHIISGAVFEPRALNELFPDWREMGAPLHVPFTEEELHFFSGERRGVKIPHSLIPKTMRNEGNYVISLGQLCRWLGEQAEAMGVEIFPGFAAAEILYGETGEVIGVLTGDMGVGKDGKPKSDYQPGVEIRAKFTIFSEGCRGHLGKQLIEKFGLQKDSDPQHYGIGIKEVWRIDSQKHKPGFVLHTLGWPLDNHTEGGGFLYHFEDNKVSLGFITALDYENPYLDPYMEFQRWKEHPKIREYLEGGECISYGARAIIKGGFQSVPKLSFPGGVLAGDDAGFLNGAKIKGNHTAMKTGMLAAEAIFDTILTQRKTPDMDERYRNSWVYEELHQSRNWSPALAKFGTFLGAMWIFLEQNIFRGKLSVTLRNRVSDHAWLKLAKLSRKIEYPEPDGKISFGKMASVYRANIVHEPDQPVHLHLRHPGVPIELNLQLYQEPAVRYCPAGVYEIITDENGAKRFQINAANCVHCKTCDIKDPFSNITWVAPEGGSGPNYTDM